MRLTAHQKREIMDAKVNPLWDWTIGDVICDGVADTNILPEQVLDAVLREVALISQPESST